MGMVTRSGGSTTVEGVATVKALVISSGSGRASITSTSGADSGSGNAFWCKWHWKHWW